jgi:hypothetical protein
MGERVGPGNRQIGNDPYPGKGYLAAWSDDPGPERTFEGRPVLYLLASARAADSK